MWPVLPPGAAHASSTRCPGASSSNRAARCAQRLARTPRRPRTPAAPRPAAAPRAAPRSRRRSAAVAAMPGGMQAFRDTRRASCAAGSRAATSARARCSRRESARQSSGQSLRERVDAASAGWLKRASGTAASIALELGALALETPQHRVHETRRAAQLEQRGGVDRRRHRRMRRDPQLLELQQADPEQRAELRLIALQRLREQPRGLPFEPVMPAQSAEHERARATTRSRSRDARARGCERVVRGDSVRASTRATSRAAAARTSAPGARRRRYADKRGAIQRMRREIRRSGHHAPGRRLDFREPQHPVAGRDVDAVARPRRRSCRARARARGVERLGVPDAKRPPVARARLRRPATDRTPARARSSSTRRRRQSSSAVGLRDLRRERRERRLAGVPAASVPASRPGNAASSASAASAASRSCSSPAVSRAPIGVERSR